MQAVKEYIFSIAGLAQIVSIIGMIVSILSFQCKSTKKLCLMQACSSTLFGISYIMLGAYTGAVSNGINIFRGTLYGLAPKKTRTVVCFCLIAAYSVGAILTYQNVFSIILLVAQVSGSISMWYNNGKVLRIVQLAIISPIWLAYNIIYFNVGGILCECFCIISVIVSMIRYRSGKYEE